MNGDEKPGWMTSENLGTWGMSVVLAAMTQSENPALAANAALAMGFVMGCYALSRGIKKRGAGQ